MTNLQMAQLLSEFIGVLSTMRDALEAKEHARIFPTSPPPGVPTLHPPVIVPAAPTDNRPAHEHMYIDGKCACGAPLPGRSY